LQVFLLIFRRLRELNISFFSWKKCSFRIENFQFFSVVLSRFNDFHIDAFIYKGSAAIIGYCGLLTISECVLFLLSSNAHKKTRKDYRENWKFSILKEHFFHSSLEILLLIILSKKFYIYDLCRYIIRLTSINLQNKNS
jgi:hypothetical protein